jgi:hypothetical protein
MEIDQEPMAGKILSATRFITRITKKVIVPERVEFEDAYNVFLKIIKGATSQIKDTPHLVTDPLKLFSETINQANAADFIKKWQKYLSSTTDYFAVFKPNPHLDTIQLFHDIDALNKRFKKRRGLEFSYLAYINPSFRQAIESNTKYTDYIFETFAQWCEITDLTELTENCFFHDGSLLKKTYIENKRSTGSHKFNLIHCMIGINRKPHIIQEEKKRFPYDNYEYDYKQRENFREKYFEFEKKEKEKESPSYSEAKKRWDIIQASSFWAEWPGDQNEWKLETVRQVRAFLSARNESPLP